MKFFKRLHHAQKGQTIVEVLVAIAIAGILLPALATALAASRAGRAQEEERLQAASLLREADEAVRSVREKGWAGFAVNGTYRPAISGSSWTLTAGAETLGNFSRQVVVSDAQRNSSGAIVASGGTVDPSTKKVVATVSWSLPLPSSVTSESYYQRHLNNTAWTQTTQAEFTAGTETNTIATATGGGQVELTTVPGGIDWTSLSLVGSVDITGTTDTTDIYVNGNYAYLAHGSALRIVNISNPAAPTLTSTYSVAGGTIADIFAVGNFVYLATSSDTAELTIVDVAIPATPSLEGSLNLGDTANANAVYVNGTTAYVGKVASGTAGINEFYVVNVANPAAPAQQGSLNLSNAVNSIYVSGNYAYLATSITNAELTIVNVTTPASPTSAGVYDASGTSIATDVFAVGTTAYLTKQNNTSGAEFFIINAATPATPTLVGNYEAGANINGVHVSGALAFLATAITNAQFRILDLATPSAPTVESSYNHGSITNSVIQSGNYAYLGSASDTREMFIMTGAATAGGYQTSGTFESTSLDAGASVGFNYLTFTLTEPASTNIQFQIATNTDNTTWNYVGPDGTAGTFYTSAGAIPLSRVSGRYLRYRASFSGPGTSTPALSDVAVNYSP